VSLPQPMHIRVMAISTNLEWIKKRFIISPRADFFDKIARTT